MAMGAEPLGDAAPFLLRSIHHPYRGIECTRKAHPSEIGEHEDGGEAALFVEKIDGDGD